MSERDIRSELAVGVRYIPSSPAPQILFKARGYLARRVRELARLHGVAETTDKALAPLLFQLPEGSWIPEKHFAVLAQLLAAVYDERKYHDVQRAPTGKT